MKLLTESYLTQAERWDAAVARKLGTDASGPVATPTRSG
jgi:hypothetical protein